MSEAYFNSIGKLLYKIAYKEANKNIIWFASYPSVSVEDLVQISICGVLSMKDDKPISAYANRMRCRLIDYYRYLDSYKRNDKSFKSIVDIDKLESVLYSVTGYKIVKES